MIEGGAGLTSSEGASLRAALRVNQKSLGCIAVILDFARYANGWSLGSPLFVVAMPIPSPSTVQLWATQSRDPNIALLRGLFMSTSGAVTDSTCKQSTAS
jgi:hypothetical protein